MKLGRLFSFAGIAPLMALCAALEGVTVGGVAYAQSVIATQENRVALVFSGGHETDPQDGGRPVALIAGALGVPDKVFREAFRSVRPARAGERPEPEQVRQNKGVLLRALGPYGITNERLDAVSDYYRYVRSRNELWPTRPATGYAVIEKGAVVRYVITEGGSGYTTPPTVSVPGYSGAAAKVQLAFGPRFERNGAVSTVTMALKNKSDSESG
jgi:hypothetical protein